jgi:glycosyltransferase involved in cell wall biosynthesis
MERAWDTESAPGATDRAPVGLVHDYLLVMRGAERTFAAMASCWPGAPIYTLLHDPAEMGGRIDGHPVVTSRLQRFGVSQGGFRRLLPLFPHAVERLPVDGHDLLVTSSSAFAHGVRPGRNAQHVVYCHSPFRYAWHERARGIAEAPPMLRPLTAATLSGIARWDLEASRRVTDYVANSEITRRRIEAIYGRDSIVVHPPVEVERFSPGLAEDFFLIVCELVPHKQVDVALAAAKRAGRRVVVVGGGPERERLEALYGEAEVEFRGRVDDHELADLYARARALIVPNVEEFGIAAVEAQAAGRPVVAANAGGTAETVVPGRTGVLVAPGDVDAYAEALRYTDFDAFSPAAIIRHAERFSTEQFRRRLRLAVQVLTGTPAAQAASRVPAGKAA